ncbi:MAG: septal ring lytic transglycosylase RlpA family protein [Acidimicrobiales bacterium]
MSDGEGGVLASKERFRRAWLLVAIVVSVVLGPKLFTSGVAPEPSPEVFVAAGSPDLATLAADQPQRPTGPTSTVVLTAVVLPETTTTTAAPPSTTTSTTEPRRQRATTTTEAPPRPSTTTTTEAPPPPSTTTTTAAPPPPPPPSPAPSTHQDDQTQQGDVSWYDLPGTVTGVCAHRTIDKGTVVTVTNLDTGESITCTVNDRGPFTDDGKVLDLARDDFTKLAPLEKGVFPARLDW